MTTSINAQHTTVELNELNGSHPLSTVVVIDTQLAEWQVLRDAAPAGAGIILIEPGADGIQVIVDALAGKSGIDALHIFSHGDSGKVQLGSATLDTDILAGNPVFTNILRESLAQNGDILIYGCDVAQGEQGQMFVEQLAQLTGADVAASDNLTGSAGLGGDWILEYRTGDIQTSSLTSLEAYQYALPTTLAAGDMVVLGWNGVNGIAASDTIRFATLVPLEAGTVIKITDVGWDQSTNAFAPQGTGDGIVTWTLNSSVAAGTVFELFLQGSDGSPAATLMDKTYDTDLTANISVAGYTITDPMGIAGDSVFIYQGAEANPFFVFGMNNSSGPVDINTNWNSSIVATARDSMLPNGNGSQNSLTNGTNAVGLPGGANQKDNVQYTGPDTQADKTTWLARIADRSLWTGDDTGTATTLSNLTMSPALSHPTLTATAVNPTFTENGNAVDLFSAITAHTNDDGQHITGLTLTISNIGNGAAEVLSFFGENSLSLAHGSSLNLPALIGGRVDVTVASGTATVVLSGLTRTAAQISELIDAMGYRNTIDASGAANRVFTITQITDSGASNNTTTVSIASTVTITGVNDAPTATNLTQTKSWSEDPGSAIALDDIVVTDLDGTDTITATLTQAVAAAGTLSTGTFGSATSTFNAGTGVWTVTGSIADVNAALAAVAFNPAANWAQNTTITTRIRDAADSGPADGTITFNVTPVNDAPVLNTSSGSVTFIENATPLIIDSGLTVSDIDSSTLASATVSITSHFQTAQDVLAFANDNATTFGNITGSYNSATGVMTLTSVSASATVAQFENALRAVTYQNTSDAPSTDSRTLSFVVNDGSANSTASVRTVLVNAVNDVPTVDAANGYINTGASLETSGVVTITNTMLQDGDVDHSGADITYTVTTAATAGTLFVDANNNGIVDGGEARESGGTFTQQSIDSGFLKYLHGGGAASADNFKFSVADPEGGSLTDLTFNLSISSRPVVTPSGVVSYTEDGAAAVVSPALTVSDTDSANLTGATISVTDFVAGDELAFVNQNGISGSYNSGTGMLTLTGTASVGNYQTALRSITFSSTSNNPATGADNHNRIVEFRVTDGGGLQSVAGTTQTLTVSNSNDAPVLDASASPVLSAVVEDAAQPAIGSLVGSTLVSSLLGGVSDVDNGAVQGMAVTAVNTGSGTLWFSTNAGTSWTTVSNAADSNALLLRAEHHVYWQPAANVSGPASNALTFRAWDATTGEGGYADVTTNGGSTAFSATNDTVSVTVTPVNDAPVLDTTANVTLTSVLEDAAAPEGGVTLGPAQGATLISTLTVGITDVDNATPGIAITGKAATGTLWFSTDAGNSWTAATAVNDESALLLRASDLVYYQPVANANGDVDVISFRAWDTSTGAEGSYTDAEGQGGTSEFSIATETVKVTVTSVNDAPTVTATHATVAFTENHDAVNLFSSASILTGPADENAQTLTGLTLTVNGLHDGQHERLVIDGSELALTHGNSLTTATNSLTASVSVTGGTATVTLSGGALSPTQMQTLIDALAYRNSSENPDVHNRVVTLTSVKDSGGTANGGVDSAAVSIASTVTVTAVNDAPAGIVSLTGAAETGATLTVTQNLTDADGLGTFSYVWKADNVVIADATASSFKLSDDQLNKEITVTISYTDLGGTLETVTSSATAKVQIPVPPPVDTTPPPAGNNVDGATVSPPTQGTAPDGSTVEVTEISIVTENRQEQNGDSDLANIPLVTGTANNTLLEVGLPTGTGMRVETPAAGEPGGISGLIAAIRSRTNLPDQSQDQQTMTENGATFLNDLPNQGADLIVRTLIPVVPAGTTVAPIQPIKISAPPAVEGDRPVATVIDARGLPSGTVIQLENIQFVAVVGNVTLVGGEGSQVVTGDGGRQIIVLGADDDVLRGGAGDDFIGSRGGDDRLYGDAGDDHVAGGAGNDHLEGGDGNDVLQGGASDAGIWQFSLVDGELVSRFEAEQPLGADAATMTVNGPWWTRTDGTGHETDNRLQFTYESVDRLQLVASLYKAAVGERAELMEFNQFVTSGMSELELSQAAVDHFFASQIVLPQAIEPKVALLVKAVWGESAATAELISIGSDFISSGGSWAEGMLILAKAAEAQQLLANADGDLVLVKNLITSETGRNQGNAGDDTLLGGAGNDRLIGGGGNNFLDGGDGIDVAVYTGAAQDFAFQIRVVDGQTQMVLTTSHTGHVDVLQNIELLKIGGYYYQPASSINNVAHNTDHALEGHLIQLTAQHVQSMDLAGIY